MRITHFNIRNFRQLSDVKINLSNRQTVFVGANNSGKTSAIQALHKFLANQGASGGSEFDTAFKTTDIPITHWQRLNEIGSEWIKKFEQQEEALLFEEEWKNLLPSLDVCLLVGAKELQYIAHLIPTLRWEVGPIGIRLRLEPKNYEQLYNDFVHSCNLSKTRIDEANTEGSSDTQRLVQEAKNVIWPTDMYDFICGSSTRGSAGRAGQLGAYFTIRSYFFDIDEDAGDSGEVPIFSLENEAEIGANPFAGVIRIDTINAQRGFGDDEEDSDRTKLSKQLAKYHDKFLNPDNLLDWTDVEALVLHKKSEVSSSEQIQRRFSQKFQELKKLNYPNITSPDILIKSKIGLSQSISSVEYSPCVNTGIPNLPEYCNGLGYQNLISITFKLMSYRDAWLQTEKNNKLIEPLHLVLIEEPEAHLHAQVQQVFIREAYTTLRRNKILKNNPNDLNELDQNFDSLPDNEQFSTQLIISTHSGHIAHECDFNELRYFKQVKNDNSFPSSIAVDLSRIFSISEEDNRKFVARYLKATYYDIFFADGVIFIEGSAERMLIPHFLKSYNNGILRQRYISLLEVNGSHVFRFKNLIDKLGITTLIITDIDSVRLHPGDSRKKACVVQLDDECFTANNTLKNWLPKKEKINELVKTPEDKKINELMYGGKVKITYQIGRNFTLGNEETILYPRTFEDALILSNYDRFLNFALQHTEQNPIKEVLDEISTICAENISGIDLALLELIKKTSKGEFALEVLFNFDPEELTIPPYIADGFLWLDQEIKRNDMSIPPQTNTTQLKVV